MLSWYKRWVDWNVKKQREFNARFVNDTTNNLHKLKRDFKRVPQNNWVAIVISLFITIIAWNLLIKSWPNDIYWTFMKIIWVILSFLLPFNFTSFILKHTS